MSEYKELNLNRASLDACIHQYICDNGLTLDGEIQVASGKKRVVFGAAGSEFAMVDLHLNNSGTTTIQWKAGKNQPLGEKLAIFLKGTIDPAEFETVNYSLSGIVSESINAIIQILGESDDFEITISRDDGNSKVVAIKSLAYQDHLTVTHHKNTKRLQIQGKPLSCYRNLIYLLTDLLDLKGLEQVLYKKDDSSAEIVRKEMAEDYLKVFFGDNFELLPVAIKKLIISGCCVKLASPVLPDYCLLLYPDLRALEGVIKQVMFEAGIHVSDSENGFGDYFDRKGSGVFVLKSDYEANMSSAGLVAALGAGYSFYNKHRHTLFHMEDFANASRLIDTLEKAISLSKDAYRLMNGLYLAKG